MTILDDFGLVPSGAAFVDIEEVYGRLEVVATGKIPGTYRYMAVCKCSCDGSLVCVRSDHLKVGNVASCGCFHKEQVTTHGMTNSGHYGRWRHMMDRCYNPECAAFPDYGGRGISVCDEWHDISTYVSELPEGFDPSLELDRIDNDGNYEPSNVRWVTRQVNTTNRRSARPIEYGGKTQSLTEWARETGLSVHLICDRLDDLGWTVERTLTTPVADKLDNMRMAQKQRWAGHTKKASPTPRIDKTFQFQGAERTIREISALTGISVNLLRKRLCERGWPIEKATA